MTSCLICYKTEDGKVKMALSRLDGYPNYTGGLWQHTPKVRDS